MKWGFTVILSGILLSAPAQKVIYSDWGIPQAGKPRFAFVHITDIHIGEAAAEGDYGTPGWLDAPPDITQEGYSAQRLRKSVEWINRHAAEHNIQWVMVTGDLTDSGELSEFLKCREILDLLTIPYVPVIGNHDVWPYTRNSESVHPCGDSLLNKVFADQFFKLSRTFENWHDGTRLIRTYNPERNQYNYLQNYSFSEGDAQFIVTDFGTRKHAGKGEPGVGPRADLHDFEGGTLPWLQQQLAQLPANIKQVYIFSHWPMMKEPINFHFAFSYAKYKRIAHVLYPHRNKLAYWLSGHIHRRHVQSITLPGQSEEIMVCVETSANKKHEEGYFRIIRVW